jgi:DNA repair exonuclease SbcCD ATPase subunit
VLTPRVISPAIQRTRRRMRLKRQLGNLQARTSNLLTACDQLLKGETPEETVLYQLFSAYGGGHYDDIHNDVHEWLRRSQEALNDAFDLRQKLLDPVVQEKRPLEQIVQDWEMLYVTFVGNSERILTLTDDELRTLLDPMLVLDREATDVQLAEQLDSIRRELTGMPLKVELMTIDPAQTDAEGILGYVDQVKAQLARLQEAQREAPGRLAQADASLKQGLFLRVMEQTADILRDIETVKAFVGAMGDHDQRQIEIDAITAQGYRPAHLPDDLKEVKVDIQAITQAVTAGDYVEAETWIEELNTDSQRALTDAQEWPALQKQNAAALRRLRDEVARIEQYQVDEAAPAWQTLQTYPEGNWEDVAGDMNQATQTLQSLHDDQVGQIERLNNLEEQKFAETEQTLTQAAADLAQAEQQLQAVVNRLAEVEAAEAHIQEALRLTETDLAQAEALRDQEDVKIGPEVDQQTKKAEHQLAEAQRLMEAREFIAATDAQSEARQLATAAYAAASEQVQEINALQTELETTARSVSGKVGQCKTQAEALSAAAKTAKTNQLVQQLADGFSKAQQARAASTGLEDRALAKALRAAIAAYDKVSQQADQSLQQIAADRDKYERYRSAALRAVGAAQAAIQKAERAVRDPDASGAGQHALQRARTALPKAPTSDVPKQALTRLRKKAEETQRYAEQAEHQARQKIRAAQARRDRQRRQAQRRRQRTIALPKRPSSKVSSKRPSSRGASRRPSSRGESRRSSSRGESKRPSSRGSSRRR